MLHGIPASSSTNTRRDLQSKSLKWHQTEESPHRVESSRAAITIVDYQYLLNKHSFMTEQQHWILLQFEDGTSVHTYYLAGTCMSWSWLHFFLARLGRDTHTTISNKYSTFNNRESVRVIDRGDQGSYNVFTPRIGCLRALTRKHSKTTASAAHQIWPWCFNNLGQPSSMDTEIELTIHDSW
jgi:hypothetical protein